MRTQERFRLDGEEVEDTILFYWSVVSMSRALRFTSEAKHQQASSYVLATVAAYYAIFHLGIFLVYSAPDLMDSELRRKINKEMLNGRRDPRRAISHKAVGKFLKTCQVHGLPSSVAELFEGAQALREFANYGPDLQRTSSGFEVFNLEHLPTEASDAIRQLNGACVDAVKWAASTNSDSRLYVPDALSIAAAYFTPNADGAPYYSGWSSPEVLRDAEALRLLLERKARELVYPAEKV